MPDKTPEIVQPHKPAITVTYDPKTQVAQLEFDPEQVKTYEFLLGLLEIAMLNAKDMRTMAQMQNMQQAQAQMQARQMEAQQVQRVLHSKNHRL